MQKVLYLLILSLFSLSLFGEEAFSENPSINCGNKWQELDHNKNKQFSKWDGQKISSFMKDFTKCAVWNGENDFFEYLEIHLALHENMHLYESKNFFDLDLFYFQWTYELMDPFPDSATLKQFIAEHDDQRSQIEKVLGFFYGENTYIALTDYVIGDWLSLFSYGSGFVTDFMSESEIFIRSSFAYNYVDLLQNTKSEYDKSALRDLIKISSLFNKFNIGNKELILVEAKDFRILEDLEFPLLYDKSEINEKIIYLYAESLRYFDEPVIQDLQIYLLSYIGNLSITEQQKFTLADHVVTDLLNRRIISNQRKLKRQNIQDTIYCTNINLIDSIISNEYLSSFLNQKCGNKDTTALEDYIITNEYSQDNLNTSIDLLFLAYSDRYLEGGKLDRKILKTLGLWINEEIYTEYEDIALFKMLESSQRDLFNTLMNIMSGEIDISNINEFNIAIKNIDILSVEEFAKEISSLNYDQKVEAFENYFSILESYSNSFFPSNYDLSDLNDPNTEHYFQLLLSSLAELNNFIYEYVQFTNYGGSILDQTNELNFLKRAIGSYLNLGWGFLNETQYFDFFNESLPLFIWWLSGYESDEITNFLRFKQIKNNLTSSSSLEAFSKLETAYKKQGIAYKQKILSEIDTDRMTLEKARLDFKDAFQKFAISMQEAPDKEALNLPGLKNFLDEIRFDSVYLYLFNVGEDIYIIEMRGPETSLDSPSFSFQKVEIEKSLIFEYIKAVRTYPPAENFEEIQTRISNAFTRYYDPCTSIQNKVHIIATGELREFPFHTLTINISDEKKGLVSKAYLIESCVFTYLPSLQSVSYFDDLMFNPNDLNFLAYGDPNFNDSSFNLFKKRGISNIKELQNLINLNESREEIEYISKLFKYSETFLGKEANESNVKGADFNESTILHFATHSIPSSSDISNQPGLALTPPNQPNVKDDGFLTYEEITNLNLKNNYISLAACNTYESLYQGAEKYSGLPSAFFEAGAQGILMSMWDIESFSAAKFNKALYKSMIQNELSFQESLGKASLELIRSDKYSHPYFWGPYFYMGPHPLFVNFPMENVTN